MSLGTLSPQRDLTSELISVEEYHHMIEAGEVLTQPFGETESPNFANTQIFQPGQSVPLRLDGQIVATINVADLLQRALAVRGK